MLLKTANKISKAVSRAREKHPEFAPDFAQAVCLVNEELGEVARAFNDKNNWEKVEEEIYDTIAVLVRMVEKDHFKTDPADPVLFPPELVQKGAPGRQQPATWRTAYPDLPRPCPRNPYEELCQRAGLPPLKD